ncbi:MAG: leucine-rich repeat domain-containing protein, partial [Lentisphaeria bacterium]|nr:leucine-rich repeat domain-containing protein [Lentisphaeria bacterium]
MPQRMVPGQPGKRFSTTDEELRNKPEAATAFPDEPLKRGTAPGRTVRQRILSGILLLITVLCFGRAASAAEGTCGENLCWELDGNGTLTISGSGEMTSHPWTETADGVKNAIIENGTTSIMDSAFKDCTRLTSISIPDSVAAIGNYAFSSTTLTEISLPANLTRIGKGAFSGSWLTGITIPPKVASIPDYLFSSCKNLSGVTFKGALTAIGEYAFNNCTDLTGISIPDTVATIGDSAFSGCTVLRNLSLPDHLRTLGPKAFFQCGLTEATLHIWTEEIGSDAFDPTVTLHVPEGSYAAQWAESHHYPLDLTPEEYTVEVRVSGQGTASADRDFGTAGTTVTLTAAASDGYRLREWETNAGGVTVTNNRFAIGSAHVAVTAVFSRICSVTVTSDGYGTASADTASGIYGTEVTLTACPNPGYRFRQWKVLSGGVSVEGNRFTIRDEDVAIRAIFEPEPEIYTVTLTDNGLGTASADPASGVTGTEVTLTAVPNAGCRFREWQVLSGGVTMENSAFRIGSANVEILAVFEQEPDPEPDVYTVSVIDDGNGTGTADPVSGRSGTEVTLTAMPNEGFRFREWQVVSGDVRIDHDRFLIGTANVVILAMFEAAPDPPAPEPETEVTVSGGRYRLDPTDQTAAFTGLQKKKTKKITIPATIDAGGKTYRVTQIAANACKGNKKLRQI